LNGTRKVELGLDLPLLGMSHRSLADVVAPHLAEWDTAFVELAIFGHADPARIAAALDDLCAEALGSRAAGALFYQSSVAAVAGLELRDGRRVVVKAHQPDQPGSTLAELATGRASAEPRRPRSSASPRTRFARTGAATIRAKRRRSRRRARSSRITSAREARRSTVKSGVSAARRSRTRWLIPLVAVTRAVTTAAARRAPSAICSPLTAPSC
jgi:hypothetical protein